MNTTHRLLQSAAIAVAVTVMASVAWADAQGKKALPPAVTQAIQANRPGAKIDKLDVEKEAGITLYDIEFKAGQGEIEVAEDGTVLDIATIVDMKDVPALAAAAIRTAAQGRTFKQVEKSEVRAEIAQEQGKGKISKLSSPQYIYEAELSKGEVEVTADGQVIKSAK